MTTEEYSSPANMPENTPAKPTELPRIWPGALIVASFWALTRALRWFDATIYVTFLSTMGASLLLVICFTIWWLTNRRIQRGDRWFAFGAVVGGGVLAAILSDKSVGPFGVIFMGVPVAITAWFLWLWVSRSRSRAIQRYGLLAVLAVVWGSFVVTRVNGIDGNNAAAISWRWSPSPEDDYVKQRQLAKKESTTATPAPAESSPAALTLQDGDWPEFRGPNRLGEVHGVKLATNWNDSPPTLLWRQKIGPAWSSVIVIGNRLITQEQRGESEAVVCLEATTGSELWSHEDKVRFSDGQAGAGPRATPTFSEGSIYSLGATGILNCLDAATGQKKWSRDIAVDSGAPLPIWGFSSSPLVAGEAVVVYAGGSGGKGMLAYHAATGEPMWTAATGPLSYSSPQLISIGGQSQILMLSDEGLLAVDAASGQDRWKYTAVGTGVWRTVQPRQIEANGFLIGSEDLGLVRVDVAYDESSWTPGERFKTRSFRPAYNDFVLLDGFVYGFDEAIFACVEATTGKRRWKGGRYGHGQALLIADQPLLLVVTETGEVVLVAANPDRHEELGRFQAIQGKTWNHPVIAHGNLHVRNDQEIACFKPKLE